jgi:urea transporter
MERGRSAGRLMGGTILIGLGIVGLLDYFFGADLFAQNSSLLVLGVGGLCFFGMFWGGPEAAKLAIPGSIISMAGFILLLQNTFEHWEPSSYAWTFVLIAIGAGLSIKGWWGHDEQSRQRGIRIGVLGIILCLVFGGLFELAPGFPHFDINEQIAVAGGMILLGLFLVVRSSGLWARLR